MFREHHIFDITVPAGTKESNKYIFEYILKKGYINSISIHFPIGCAGLVSLGIYYLSKPILPYIEDQWLRFDDYIYHYNQDVELITEPSTIQFFAFSPYALYDHTLTISIVASSSKSDFEFRL